MIDSRFLRNKVNPVVLAVPINWFQVKLVCFQNDLESESGFQNDLESESVFQNYLESESGP